MFVLAVFGSMLLASVIIALTRRYRDNKNGEQSTRLGLHTPLKREQDAAAPLKR